MLCFVSQDVKAFQKPSIIVHCSSKFSRNSTSFLQKKVDIDLCTGQGRISKKPRKHFGPEKPFMKI